MRIRATLAATTLPALLLSGCGPAAVRAGQPDVEGGDEPATARALAAVAAEYAPGPDSAERLRWGVANQFDRGVVAVDLRYGSGGEYDGDTLGVAVGTGLDRSRYACGTPDTEYLAGCELTDRGVLFWEDEAPEEDPGVVRVAVEKGDATVLVWYAGPAIVTDPREMDTPITVGDLFALANDPRVDVTTSQAAIEAGTRLDFWKD